MLSPLNTWYFYYLVKYLRLILQLMWNAFKNSLALAWKDFKYVFKDWIKNKGEVIKFLIKTALGFNGVYP